MWNSLEPPPIFAAAPWMDGVFSVAVVVLAAALIAAFGMFFGFLEWLDYTPAKQRERELQLLEKEVLAHYASKKGGAA